MKMQNKNFSPVLTGYPNGDENIWEANLMYIF